MELDIFENENQPSKWFNKQKWTQKGLKVARIPKLKWTFSDPLTDVLVCVPGPNLDDMYSMQSLEPKDPDKHHESQDAKWFKQMIPLSGCFPHQF